METTLHRQLKDHFAGKRGSVEVPLGSYRIDVVRSGRLIEIQHSSLSQISGKIRDLCTEHLVDVVKPLVVRKRLIKMDKKEGSITDQRWSPKQGSLIDLFGELVHFTKAFPHPNLRLIVPQIDVEEIRYPGHGKRRRRRKNDFQVQELKMISLSKSLLFRRASDLLKILGCRLPPKFDTAVISRLAGIDRHEAQRAAYCLREMGAIEQVGKKGNAAVYSKKQTCELRAPRKPSNCCVQRST